MLDTRFRHWPFMEMERRGVLNSATKEAESCWPRPRGIFEDVSGVTESLSICLSLQGRRGAGNKGTDSPYNNGSRLQTRQSFDVAVTSEDPARIIVLEPLADQPGG
jgi:hypothetical protein